MKLYIVTTYEYLNTCMILDCCYDLRIWSLTSSVRGRSQTLLCEMVIWSQQIDRKFVHDDIHNVYALLLSKFVLMQLLLLLMLLLLLVLVLVQKVITQPTCEYRHCNTVFITQTWIKQKLQMSYYERTRLLDICIGLDCIIKDLPSVLTFIIAEQTLNDSRYCSNKYN